MPINYSLAIDEMFGMANAAFVAAGITDIRWPGKPESVAVPTDRVWTRVSAQIVSDRQASLSNDEGKRRFEAVGLLYVQLFCPRLTPSTLDDGRALGRLLQSTFRGHSPSDEVWFRNVRVIELPPTAENYPINVVAEFRYESVEGANVVELPPIPTHPPTTATAWKKHYPVEAPDGLNNVFTFVGLPDDPTMYMLLFDGVAMDAGAENDFVSLGNGQVQFANTPQGGDTPTKVAAYY